MDEGWPPLRGAVTRFLNADTPMKNTSRLVLVLIGSFLLSSHSCSSEEAPDSPDAGRSSESSDAGAGSGGGDSNVSVANWQSDLLALAFDAASAFPLDPHIKNRSRAQHVVVGACLELGLADRAHEYAAEIANWRRAVGYAEIALYFAERGAHQAFADTRTLVERELGRIGLFDDQKWRRDRARATLARACLLVEDDEAAAELSAGLVEDEAGAVLVARSSRVQGEELDSFLTEIDGLLDRGTFAQLESALDSLATLYARYYADSELRGSVRDRIERYSTKLPEPIQLKCNAEMVAAALEQGDRGRANALLDRAQQLINGGRWLPGDHIALVAQQARWRARAGDQERALAGADSAVAMFEAQRDGIVDIDRADALCPVAEAYVAIGDENQALETYRRALEESVHNPNSRPRVDDLTQICCSMAQQGVEPDAALWQRLREVRDSLGQPW